MDRRQGEPDTLAAFADRVHPAWTIGVKAGGLDDADHIVQVRGSKYTLCGMDAATRNVDVLEPDLMVEVNAACWTCLREGQALLKQRAIVKAASEGTDA